MTKMVLSKYCPQHIYIACIEHRHIVHKRSLQHKHLELDNVTSNITTLDQTKEHQKRSGQNSSTQS